MPLELVPDEDPERHWTVQELAENLRVSPKTVASWIDAGHFGPYQDVAGKGDRKARRVPESGRQLYLNNRTIHPRRTA